MKIFTLLCAFTAIFGTSFVSAQEPASSSQSAQVAEINWMTDFEAAKAAANTQGKPMFLYFTGSDWCPWCKKMDKEILSTPEFQQAMADKIVFVKVDFPRQTKLDKATKEQNDKLAKTFEVTGFPSAIILDKNGHKIEKIGYQQGGGAKYAQKLTEIIDAYNKQLGQ
jgi:protein disulfide-isomerase